MTAVYEQTIASFSRGLTSLLGFFDKAGRHAEARKFDVDTLASARVAPDMYPLARQVQITCDTAKAAAARLVGKDPPRHEDTEQTFTELRQRVEKTLAYLATVKPEALIGCEDQRVPLPWAPGKWMHAAAYIDQMAVPNFYFHLAATYLILRHNGVELGKMDYLGPVDIQG